MLYIATDADGNKARCGFTVTVKPEPTIPPPTRPRSYGHERNQHPNNVLPPPSIFGTTEGRQNITEATNRQQDNNKHYHKACDKPPQIENGVMSCRRIAGGSKKCSPVCNAEHDFYQRFSRLPSYLCNRHRVDWNVRRFIPDCSPVHKTRQGRSCQSGWETRSIAHASKTYRSKQSNVLSGSVICVACPPGMYRNSEQYSSSSQSAKKRLCQLCPKGMYSDQFGSSICMKCPLNHTTRGLGSRKAKDCYYAR